MTSRPRVAFVQDHLVQRGGAERALLSMLKAAPGAEVVTAFYQPEGCYPAFGAVAVRTSVLDRVPPLRAHHRLALPLLPFAWSALAVDAEVAVCCTSGWAQGIRATGRKVVYFHAPTRWLYERDAYLRGASPLTRTLTAAAAPPLRWWDRRTVASGHRFLTQGTVMQRRLHERYGIEAEVLPVPNTFDPKAVQVPVDRLEPGFFLCASRLMPYKNVDVLLDAFRRLPAERLVVAGDGPRFERLAADLPANVTLLGRCEDDVLRWLYASCAAVVSAAIEPFGMTPVEAAAFGRPTVALDAGGFVDTVVDGETGVRFSRPEPASVVDGLRRFRSIESDLDPGRITAHAEQYGEARFVDRLRRVIDEEAGR